MPSGMSLESKKCLARSVTIILIWNDKLNKSCKKTCLSKIKRSISYASNLSIDSDDVGGRQHRVHEQFVELILSPRLS